jgi:hypothetical protein
MYVHSALLSKLAVYIFAVYYYLLFTFYYDYHDVPLYEVACYEM